MTEPILGLWAVYLTEYPDEGSALIEARNATEAIRLARIGGYESVGGPWESEPADALTAEEMTPEAMVRRIANEEADAAGTIEGQWLANVVCGQAMEIGRLRAWADEAEAMLRKVAAKSRALRVDAPAVAESLSWLAAVARGLETEHPSPDDRRRLNDAALAYARADAAAALAEAEHLRSLPMEPKP